MQEQPTSEMQGRITRYVSERGFGFIQPDERDRADVFFHVSSLASVFEPAPGLRVRYATIIKDGRERAERVELINGR